MPTEMFQLSPGQMGVRLGSVSGRCQLLCQGERHAAENLSPWQGQRCSWTDVSSRPRATALAAAVLHAINPPPSALTATRLSVQEVGRGREKYVWALLEAEATMREVTKARARV